MIFHGTTPVSVDLSASKKRTLRKLYLALALISAASIQTACSAIISGRESASESPAATSAPTDHATDGTTDDFGSVIPPLGTFDRRDPDFIQYKPCLEMPDEFLAQAGLHGKEMMEGVGEVDGVCSFEAGEDYGESVFKLHGSRHGFADFERLSGEIGWNKTSGEQPILLHRSEYLSDTECQVAVETNRGTLAVSFQSFKTVGQDIVHDPCDAALRKLETVLELDGKHENQL